MSTADRAVAVLLRGVNVGPHRRVSATDLRAAAAETGLTGARTYATSGNLVALRRADTPPDVAAARLTAALEPRTGAPLQAVALTTAELAGVVEACPFPDAAEEDPARLQVHVGDRPVDEPGITALAQCHSGPERFAVARGVLYVHYVDGIGRSRLTPARIDGAAGTWTTGRNWRTILRLLAMAQGPGTEQGG